MQQLILNDDFRTALIKDGSHYRTLTCKSGLTMSVQGGEYIYSSPRENVHPTQFTQMEVGFPSKEVELLNEYADEVGNPTGTVYPYTPVEVIQQVIDNNGGLV